jgi:hypothetical protein
LREGTDAISGILSREAPAESVEEVQEAPVEEEAEVWRTMPLKLTMMGPSKSTPK